MDSKLSGVTEISKTRFDILAGYSRKPGFFLFGEEISYFSVGADRVLGALVRDTTDDDFAGLVIGQDEYQQYRCVEVRTFTSSLAGAEADLRKALLEWMQLPDSDFYQGGPPVEKLDALLPCVPAAKLHPSFLELASKEAFAAARDVVERMMPYFVDIDGNFIKDFQTDGFDARLWELYLFAALTEQGCAFDRSIYAPDYKCDYFGYSFYVEATSVNPTKKNGVIVEPDPWSMPPNELKAYFLDYVPMKWGSALYSKLKKQYRKLPHVSGRPLLFAVQDFHAAQSMAVSGSSLMPYLYGLEFSALYDSSGKLVVNQGKKAAHEWGGKTIPSGFFLQPEAENVSAVISNPLGTIAKFNRIGFGAGFGSKRIKMFMIGTCHDHDPNAATPIPFQMEVKPDKWDEPWCGGMSVFHNPNAKHPLDSEIFKNVAQYHLVNGQLVGYLPDFHPYGALNTTIIPED